jgi:hypothetical protein
LKLRAVHTDATQGTVIEDRAIVELPLQAAAVEFAARSGGDERDDMRGGARLRNAGSQWSSMGAGSFRGEFQIDGVSAPSPRATGGRAWPLTAALFHRAFKIVTNPFDASAGNSWAPLNVSTRAA